MELDKERSLLFCFLKDAADARRIICKTYDENVS